jgi:hypothetical protein
MNRNWRTQLWNDLIEHDTFHSLPDTVYRRFVGRGEWVSELSDMTFSLFILLVLEAA